MPQLYQTVLVIHVTLGTVALMAFWAALFARKGSRQHLLRGRVFVVTMTATVLTALALCLAVNVFDPLWIRPPTKVLSDAEIEEYPHAIRTLFNAIAGGGVFALVS